jgi:ATP-dependent helicase/nuclease subunit A
MLHSIVEQMHPSPEQEPAITARGCDVLVTAGAGTGKTRTLVARYLSLLADDLPLRSVVAITFTRKAAREMRNRVRSAVQQHIRRPDIPPHERQHWETLYAELDAARIDTIHGLCTEILRAHPAEADVDPRFAVLQEGQAYLLQAQVLDEVLAWAADDEQTAPLFSLLTERGLRQTLHRLLAARLDAQETWDGLPADIEGLWRSRLEQHQQAALDALLSRDEWVSSVALLQENRAERPHDKLEVQRRAALRAVSGGERSLEQQLASLACLADIHLNVGSAKAWPGGVGQRKEVKDALRILRDLWKREDISRWTFSAMDQQLASALPALRSLFDLACRRYQDLKREQNALDFDDLEQGALQLLRCHPSLASYWQDQVQAILVDEFQDTNGRQRDLVALLNGAQGRMFAVGDAKQSIYRFRGADVTVFRAERERIQRSGGQVSSLEVSYRAHRALIEALNEALRPVLGEEEDPARPWAEPFAALRHHRDEPGPGFSAPYVELHLTAGSKSGGALDLAADALAARLVDLVESGRFQVDRGGPPRALAYDDVAILCRASSSFPYYEDAFERAGIPFLTIAGAGFYDRPEVRDLLNALQALADPTDDLALVGLLRSPAFALSDVALYRLCQQRDAQGKDSALWHLLQRSGDALCGEAGQRAAQIIADLYLWAGRTSVANLLKALLDATDYRATLIRTEQRRAARNVSKLLADAQASGIVGVGAFLEYVQGLRDVAAREAEARTLAEGAVQIMSVHQAKGLEFPVVVLGDVTYGGGRGGRGLLIDPQLGILLPLQDEDKRLPGIYQLGQQTDQDQDDAESDRLLYVAATRAQEMLILSGCVRGRLNDRCWLGRFANAHGWAFDAVWDGDPEGTQTVEWCQEVGQSTLACTVYEPNWMWTRGERVAEQQPRQTVPVPPPLLHAVAAGGEWADERTREAERDPPQRVWRIVPAARRPRAPAWVVGKLVHESLAAWHIPDEGFARWAQSRARSFGLTDHSQLDDAVGRCCTLLQRFAQHDLFAEMNRAEHRWHEVPYHLQGEDGTIESGIIDALYVHNGRWAVVEFKTDRVRDAADFQDLLAREDYLAQANRYGRAVHSLLGQRPRLLFCMLDYAGGIHIHELHGNGGM